MKNILELKEKRKALRDEAVAILDASEKENRSMSADELTKYEKIDADIDLLTREISAVEKMIEEQRKAGEQNNNPLHNPGKDEGKEEERQKKPIETEEYREAYTNFLRYGYASLTQEERSVIDNGHQNLSGTEARAMSAITGAAGGYTVPQGFFAELEKALKDYGGMRDVARIIPTAAGNDLPMPSMNDTGNVGELVGENTAVSNQDVAFGTITMKAYKYSSKTVLIPIELLQDSAIDVEAEVKAALAERIFRITNTHYTTGDNTSKPQGIVVGAALGKAGATGQTTSLIYDDLIDLQHSVDAAYRRSPSCGYMFADSTLKILKKLKDSQGRPLWVPGVSMKEPDTINGYRYAINNDIAAMAASAKSMLFGDFSKYLIRDVMDVMVIRISEKYIESGQVGFLCYYRTDGRLRDAGTNPIKYYQNSAT